MQIQNKIAKRLALKYPDVGLCATLHFTISRFQREKNRTELSAVAWITGCHVIATSHFPNKIHQRQLYTTEKARLFFPKEQQILWGP